MGEDRDGIFARFFGQKLLSRAEFRSTDSQVPGWYIVRSGPLNQFGTHDGVGRRAFAAQYR